MNKAPAIFFMLILGVVLLSLAIVASRVSVHWTLSGIKISCVNVPGGDECEVM